MCYDFKKLLFFLLFVQFDFVYRFKIQFNTKKNQVLSVFDIHYKAHI